MTHSKNRPLTRIYLLPLLALGFAGSACAEDPDVCTSSETAHFADMSWTAGVTSADCRDMGTEPFAVGSVARFRVDGGELGLSYAVTDASVLQFTPLTDGVEVRFVAAGSGSLSALGSDGSVVARLDLEASLADRVEWQVGAELMGATPAIAGTPNVAVGGHAPILASLYAAGQPLRGGDALEVRSGPAFVRQGSRTGLDWLVVTPDAVGEVVIQVALGAGPVVSYRVNAVASEDIARLELRSVGSYLQDDEDRQSVYAQAFLADGAPVLGAPVEWRMADDTFDTRGDVFQYTLDPARTSTLGARVGDASVALEVHTASTDARVAQGDELACSASGDARAGLGTLGLAMLALLAVSRRRHLRMA